VTLLSITQQSNQQIRKFDFTQVYKIDKLFVESFSKVLDESLFNQNLGKFNIEYAIAGKHIQLIFICQNKLKKIVEHLFDEPNGKHQVVKGVEQGLIAFDLT